MSTHSGHVGKVNVFSTTSLDLSFEGYVPTFLNYSLDLAAVADYLLWVCFSESYVILLNYTQHVC